MKNSQLSNTPKQKISADAYQYSNHPLCKQVLSELISNDDELMFQSESESETQHEDKQVLVPWKILIADDDTNVHDTTVLALNGVLIQGRPLTFTHAYSAQGAHKLISEQTDIALVLLDVVMESTDAGLKLVLLIRNELGRKNLRIILRTGQPGYAKEGVLAHYQIDGYASKSQLTRSILIKMISEALDNTNTNDILDSEIH